MRIPKKKDQNKTSMVKAMGSFIDSEVPSSLSGPRTDVCVGIFIKFYVNSNYTCVDHKNSSYGLLVSVSVCVRRRIPAGL